MATLAQLAEEYRESAVRLRVGLREAEQSEDMERAKTLRQMLHELHRVRRVLETYYTGPRNNRYTMARVQIVRGEHD